MINKCVVALIVTASVIVVGVSAFVAVSWWRRYFRRLFEARFQPQEDGSYLAYWSRGQQTELYRIDAFTKERVLAFLINGSVASTGLFVVLIVSAVAINVFAPTSLIIPGALLLGIVAFVPQRRANRQAGRLILTGTRVDGGETMRPSAPREATTRSFRLIILMSCLIAVLGVAVGVILFLDPDSGTIEWTEAGSFLLLLVVLPLSVAIFNWWVLRRIRASPHAPSG